MDYQDRNEIEGIARAEAERVASHERYYRENAVKQLEDDLRHQCSGLRIGLNELQARVTELEALLPERTA